MERLRATLPPLEPLVAFEAAARHESFTRAAEELALSQAAVSQRIRSLEAHLGVALFARANRRVQLTAAGRALQHAAAPALRQIAAAAAELRQREGRVRLTLGVDQAIAALWLMPRLTGFLAEAGEVSLRVVASDVEAECLAEDVDIAILHGRGLWPGRDAAALFAEEVFPVASPAYLARAGWPQRPADLAQHALLELDDRHWDWMNWRVWLARSGVHAPVAHEPLRINAYPLVIDAAKRGEGVALGWRHLVDQDVAAGALVRPMAQSVSTDFGYHLVWPAGRALSPPAMAFRERLLAENSGD